MNLRKLMCALLVLVLAVSCTGLVNAEGDLLPAEETAETRSHVTVGHATKVSGAFFSRQFGNNTSDIDVRAMIHGYNPIVWDTQLTYVYDPQVVRSVTTSTDGDGDKVYTFTLWDDLKWNDGTPITAGDYVFGFALQTSAEFEEISGDTDIWEHLKGYEEYVSGEADTLAGVRLLDTYVYSVTVKKEYLQYFYERAYLYMMPSPILVLAPGCEVADDGNGVYIRNIDSKNADPIFTADLLRQTILDRENGYLYYPYLTCGPYNLVSYDRESGTVEFTANEYYKANYRGYRPSIQDITLVFVLPQEMAQKMADGEVDVLNKVVDGKVIDELKGLSGDFTHKDYPRLGYGYIGLTNEQGPQQFVKVRQAIAYGFETEEFVDDFLGEYGTPVYGFYGIGQWMTMAAMGSLRPDYLLHPEKETPPTEEEAADPNFIDRTKETLAMWDACTLDHLNRYSFDLDKSLKLLIEDGWVLNSEGKDYDPDTDTVRYKDVNGELMALSFDFGLIEDDEAAQDVLRRLQNNLTPLGVEFIVHEDSFYNILVDWLREEGTRKYDMSFLAYNFNSIFDPLIEFASDGEVPGTQNATAIYDKELIDLCWKLHHTAPGDLLTFLQRWIAFQERFNELLPTVPLYSNEYYDFFISNLHNYNPDGEANWPRAIIAAILE